MTADISNEYLKSLIAEYWKNEGYKTPEFYMVYGNNFKRGPQHIRTDMLNGWPRK